MKILYPIIALFFSISTFINAQVGKVGINTTTPASMLHVKDSSVLFSGINSLPATPGNPPASGPGTRMMWYPNKAAFRAGGILTAQWDKDSIGQYSVAIGHSSVAKGFASVALGSGNRSMKNYSTAIGYDNESLEEASMAFGLGNRASNNYSIALGQQNTSSGIASFTAGKGNLASSSYSIAMGENSMATNTHAIALGRESLASGQESFAFGRDCKATENHSIAMGYACRAEGWNSMALGELIYAKSAGVVVMGHWNDTTLMTSPINPISSDAAFVIGNGAHHFARSNAFTVLYNGKTGINTETPDARLHVEEGFTNGPYNSSAVAIFEGAQGSFIQLSNENTIQSGILSGNQATDIRSALIFRADSSVQIRTGGNTTRFSVEKTGSIGIGTTAPQRLLHIHKGSSGATPNTSAIAVFENNSDASICLLTPNANESGIFFGNPSNSAHGGIVYNSNVANGLAFRTNGNSTKAVITSTGDMGIGDNSPNARLHIANGVAGGIYHSQSELIIEDDDNSYIQFSTPTAEESGFLSGNSLTSVRSGLIFTPDSAVDIRSGGNTTRVRINDVGDVGIGDLSPNARLHVSNGTGGSLYFPEADVVIEDNNNAYLQFSSPSGFASGLLSGNTATDIRSALLFLGDSSVQIRAGGNTTRLTVSKTGNVGIGTGTPGAKLDVNGTTNLDGLTTVGANGSALTEVIKTTLIKDVASIAAGGSLNVDFAVSNSALTSTVYISPESDLPNGMLIGYARVHSAGTVRVRFTNISGAAIDLANMNYYITVIR